MLKNKIKQALTELRKALEKLLGDNLIEVRLFGSMVRGNAQKVLQFKLGGSR